MSFISIAYPQLNEFNSSDTIGWTSQNGVGAATIDGGFKLEMLAAQNAANLYPDGNNPRYYKDITSDISTDWDLWVRIISHTLHSDSRAGISIGDSADTVNCGVNVGIGLIGEMFSGPFSNSVLGVVGGTVPSDGTGWIGVSCRGGCYSALAGTGTSKNPPTNYASVARTTLQGQNAPSRLSLYLIKWGGADTNVIFDNIKIYRK